MESLRAECDQWRKLHTADLEWLAQSCQVIIEDPRAKRPGGAVGSWRGLAATTAGAAAIAGGCGKKGGKPGGGGKAVATRPQQQAPPRAAGPARSEGSLAPEVMQVAEVLRCVAEIRGREAGRRTNMEELGVDVLISAPQKGWTGPSCAGLVMLGPRGVAATRATKGTSFVVDLRKWLELMDSYEVHPLAPYRIPPAAART